MTQQANRTATAVFAPRPDEIQAARDFVRHAVAEAGPGPVADAVLMTSELITNAIAYGRGDLAVTVEPSPAGVRVEVGHANRDHSTPHLAVPGPDGIGGHGLHIVDQLATRWGSERRHDGYTRVWFELASSTW